MRSPRPKRRRSSEQAEKQVEKKDQKPADKRKVIARRPAKIKLSSYDRLYIDANRDGDLTNDPVLKPMKNPPWNLIPGNRSRFAVVWGRVQQQPPPAEKERMAFEVARIDIDYGPGVGVQPFKIFPWFILTANEQTPALRFAAATARKGTIQIGKSKCEALLMQRALPAVSITRRRRSIWRRRTVREVPCCWAAVRRR